MTLTMQFPFEEDPSESVDAAFDSALDGDVAGLQALLRGLSDTDASVRRDSAEALKDALEMLDDNEIRTVNLTTLFQLEVERSASVSPALIRLTEKCRALIRNSRR